MQINNLKKKNVRFVSQNSSDWLNIGVQRRHWEDFLLKIKKVCPLEGKVHPIQRAMLNPQKYFGS